MKFRVYFNRTAEQPQVWSVDEGTQDSEINVKALVISDCPVISRYNGNPVNRDTPSAWFEIEAKHMEVHDGIAYFHKG